MCITRSRLFFMCFKIPMTVTCPSRIRNIIISTVAWFRNFLLVVHTLNFAFAAVEIPNMSRDTQYVLRYICIIYNLFFHFLHIFVLWLFVQAVSGYLVKVASQYENGLPDQAPDHAGLVLPRRMGERVDLEVRRANQC